MVEENTMEESADNDEPSAIFEINDENGDLITEGYNIIAQSPKGLFPDDTNGEDPGDDPDTGEIWRAATADDDKGGALWLAAGAIPPDYEDSNYPNRYIIAVEAGPDGAKTVEAFTIVVTDINEAPAFEVDKDNGTGNPKGIAINIAEADEDPEWALYVLETTINGGAVGEVRDTDGNLSDDTTPGRLSGC